MRLLFALLALPGCFIGPDALQERLLDVDRDGVLASEDCDDGDPAVGAGEQRFPDGDNDGFGDSDAAQVQCAASSGFAEVGGDCDDGAADVWPDAPEACDGEDQDCDGRIDEDASVGLSSWWPDQDGDGFGEEGAELVACEAPSGHAEQGGDCDDGDAGVNPDVLEICGDAIDQDCDTAAPACALSGAVLLEEATARALGAMEGDGAGHGVLSPGDLDGDGQADLVVSAPWADDAGRVETGAVYVVSGPAEGDVVLEPARVLALYGPGPDVYAGTAVAAGDIDGDGALDLLIGASSRGPEAGWWVPGPVDGQIRLDDAVGFTGGGLYQAPVGDGIGVAGDIDGTGLNAVLVASRSAVVDGEDGAGVVFALVGLESNLDAATATVEGEAGAEAGASLGSAGDWNDDGVHDWFVGAPGVGMEAGAVYVIDGSGRGVSDLAGAAMLVLEGPTPGARAGEAAIGRTGDEGQAELVVGLPGFVDGDAVGAVAVVRGPLSGTVALEEAEHLLVGVAGGDRVGAALAVAGDSTGDGRSGLVIGAPGADGTGRAYLVLGPLAAGAWSLDQADAQLVGEQVGDGAGNAVAGGADIDGDGYSELWLGAAEARSGAGAAYLLSGGPVKE